MEFINEIVPPLAALLGVLVAGLLALVGYYLKSRMEHSKEVRARHFEQRFAIYQKAHKFAFDSYQTGSKQYDIEEIREINRELLIVGAPEVVRAFNLIADTSADKLRAQGMSSQGIRQQQSRLAKNLVNAIRTDLYPHQEALELQDMRFIERKKSKP